MTRAEIDRALLALRERKMAQSAFAHFRGTGEDFHRRTLPDLLRLKAPAVWLNGDLHLENFGTYRGDNRLTYFDIGDFDDACLGPAVIDLARFLAGIMVAAPEMGLTFAAARDCALQALKRYRAALVDGKARWVERRIAAGAIGDLLRELEGRSQIDLLAKRTVLKNGRRRLRFDTGKALKLEKAEAARVVAALDRFARDRAAPGFFRVLDVAQRVAGLGALGRPRYVVLIAGNSKAGNSKSSGGKAAGGRYGPALIDLKFQPGSILAPLLAPCQRQPGFANEARRVVEIEYRLQAAAPAFLTELAIGRRPFTFRELQPDQDKLEARHLAGDAARRGEALGTMAELIAWAQLRSGGWRGSAAIDELMAWGGNRDWPAPLLALATRAAKTAIQAWAAARPAAR
jgi:uncharacterized protein (DUF2252 family)